MRPDQARQPLSEILIVDDIPANLGILSNALEPEGYQIIAARDGEAALKIARSDLPDLIILDVSMPGMSGFEVCRELKEDESTRSIPVIFVTAMHDTENIIEGFQAGGVDYVTRPFREAELLARVQTHLENNRLTQELRQKNKELQAEIAKREQAENALEKADERLSHISEQEAKRWGIAGFIGKSKTVGKILEDVRRLHRTGSTSVLITGESGTGKELIARAIHFGGPRTEGPFIPVNCSAIPGELAESIFFGHVRGAFSGANTSRKGCFELADEGTLFLDEIGDMPLELQPKLLRVIEDGLVLPVGGAQPKHVDVRIVAATNQDLSRKIAEGTFREELYFRLARYTVPVPPLRQRREDIPLLSEHFLSTFALEMGIPQPALSFEALSIFESYHFPGNIRELKNVMEHALIKSSGEPIIKPVHLHFIDSDALPTVNAQTTISPQDDKSSLQPKHIEELVIQRAQKPKAGIHGNTDSSSVTHEESILASIREQGSISNSECRDLLSVDFDRASYLLKKMQRYGLLVRQGKHRWARYRLP
ncbi:sigma-54-dependent Fis family transcriptional regulator [bacterium]|nr:sigma-54-dependent Fis family transcriptional regulator [bacterium]